jgi:hypothetical protein
MYKTLCVQSVDKGVDKLENVLRKVRREEGRVLVVVVVVVVVAELGSGDTGTIAASCGYRYTRMNRIIQGRSQSRQYRKELKVLQKLATNSQKYPTVLRVA